ncbi:succinate--CoA ligase subunit beta [Brevirhabdus pacifica]|uniref:Succinate--CoA ligase subunit beta n=1 Tax=Brevirhabdus pacifica TaxID=1267768 RepID=A0A1U7DK00_9RHOB|nr:ADP-forming succinate--CoA ligase subunit beta [Brevirhabdus pacifica]APX90301.1 succinate--CoA ligase subunit beta [Brevirhabdus pacifica]OWU78656.1 succinyl-CoA synthetase subunit beta [Loktanella sp. 22II-4b]PJJ80751.1 succinyl-CoA synthetase beta subunit [Brevirhabdus pacifica]
MILSEHQSKELLAQYGVRIPDGRLARTAEEAEQRCREIRAEKYVVKAQIGAGGRGLAGGVRFAATPTSVRDEAERMIGKPLVTEQTSSAGETVASVYVEAAVDIAEDYYVALVIDPSSGQPTLLASTTGGVDFEKTARRDPGVVDSLSMPKGAKTPAETIAAFLADTGFPSKSVEGAAEMVQNAARAFVDNDMTLAEINPLALTAQGDWIAVDAKVILDDNASFRHPEFEALRGRNDWSADERVAHQNEINLVKLDGNIGVVVNGAGLGLATNDMLIDAGGAPANFMDIRTTATSFQIARGVELLLADPKVRIILLNVHGGGMTACDTVAEGVAFAYSRSERKLPIVARLAGQSADWATRLLKDRRLPFESRDTLGEAVRRAVELAQKGGK